MTQEGARGQNGDGQAALHSCDHEWVVFSTDIGNVFLLVQCVECGAYGTVNDPTVEEWKEAFHAPSSPYRWDDAERVHVRGMLPPERWYVQKAPPNGEEGE